MDEKRIEGKALNVQEISAAMELYGIARFKGELDELDGLEFAKPIAEAVETIPNLVATIGDRDRHIAELESQKKNAVDVHHEQEYRIRQLGEALNAANSDEEKYWAWIPGDDNHLETLSCPVKIPAEWLRNLIDEPKQQNATMREVLNDAIYNLSYHAHDEIEIRRLCKRMCEAIAKLGGAT